MVKGLTRSLGFTLMEMVTVLVILGIVLVGIGSFVTFGTQIYVDSNAADRVIGSSRFAIQRMTRELRTALPNSVRLNSNNISFQCLEFVPTVTSTSYLDLPFVPASAANTGKVFLDKKPSSNGQSNSDIAANQRAYVYPVTTAEVYSPSSNPRKYADIQNASSTGDVVNLIFTRSTQFAERSPSERMFFTHQPVSYCVQGSQLLRYANYGFHAIQRFPNQMGTGSLMAQNIVNSLNQSNNRPFFIDQATLEHSAIIRVQPIFNFNGSQFQYHHQVQVLNVP
ncbi:MAG: PilW family protein [Parashewanella sp.]